MILLVGWLGVYLSKATASKVRFSLTKGMVPAQERYHDPVASDFRAASAARRRALLRGADHHAGWRCAPRSGLRAAVPHWPDHAAFSWTVATFNHLEYPRSQGTDRFAAAR